MRAFLWDKQMYELLAQRAFNTPLLIEPGKLDVITDVLLSRMKGGKLSNDFIKDYEAFSPQGLSERREGGYSLSGSVGVINVHGSLAHRGGYMDAMSGLTSYDTISKQLDAALADNSVKTILLNMDSPGGEVAGVFDLAEKIRAANSQKPIHALAADMMCSACYLIGANVTSITATQTANVGSIGVVMRHMDLSSMNKKAGVKQTYVYAGENKVDGNSSGPLSEGAKERAQAGVDKIYNMFIDVVAQGRTLDYQAIIDTKANVFIGDDAVKAGLADFVMSGDELLEKLNAQYSVSSGTFTANNEEIQMADEPATPETTAEVPALDPSEIIAEANARSNSIITCEHAEGREKMANHLAFNTTMSAEEAIALLELAPVTQTAEASPLDAAMKNTEQPDISADIDQVEPTAAERIFKNYSAATGYKGAI